MKKNNYSKTIFIVMACVSLFSPVALAGDLYWGTSGIWNSGTLWFADAVRTTPSAWVSGSVAHFDQAATITGPNAGITIGGIVANENVSVTGGNYLNTGNVPVSFNVASGKLLDFGTQGLITTAGTSHGIIKDGAGALTIAGNLYLGGFTLNTGTVTAKGANAFGAGVLTVNGGSIGAGAGYTYAAKGVNIRGDFTIGGVTTGGGISTAAYTFAATAPVSLGSATRTITLGGTGIVTFSGNMTGDAGVGLTLSSTITSGTALSPLKLVGDNIGYQGVTTINAYTMLKLGSANALGTTDAGTVVNSGGTLDIFGTNYSAAEPVTLKGSSTFAAISNTTGVATFNGPITLENSAYVNGAGGVLNLTNTIGGNGTLYLAGVSGGSISGIISVNSGLWVNNGSWTISGANTYSGNTTINASKTLILGASGTIPDESGLVVNGTFKTGATVGFSETLGTLTINDNSTIELGTGVHTLTFANSSAVAWTAGKMLTITGWAGDAGSSGTNGRIFIGNSGSGLTSTQLAQISFIGYAAGAQILTTGEIVPLQTSITSAVNSSTLGLTSSTNLSVASDVTLAIDNSSSLNSVTLAPGAKLTLNSGQTLTATNGITLQSDATGTATILNSGTYTGTVTAQQYLGSARNWYISSPVTNATSPATNITRYYEYVEAGNNADFSVTGSTAYWKGLSTGHSMAIGKGYIAQASAGTTVQFSGTPNNGNITTSFNLTRDDAKGKGYNLVGNPYPSYIDWSLVAGANTNLMSTAWFKTKKTDLAGGGYTFASVNVTTPSTPEIVANNANTTITKYIPPTQAFWVRVKSGTSSTSMNFTNAMREHRLDNGDLMKAPKVNERSRLRLQLVNGIESDETLIYFDKIATNDFNEYDSPKMMNNSTVTPDLYTKAGVERLVINGMNAIVDNIELPLGFSLNAAASLKLKATEMSNFPLGTRIYLLDKMESSQVELLPETEYSFSTTAATTNSENRFSLIFRTPNASTGIDNAEKGITQVFVNAANQITIIAPEKASYSVFNAVGQKVTEGITKVNRTVVNGIINAGVYVIQVCENGRSNSTRIILNGK